jgi:hypothetical protein
MATESNKQRKSKYPKRANKRDLKVNEQNGLVVTSAETYSITSNDNIRYVRNTGVSTINLPPAAENKGRAISFYQTSADILTIDPTSSEQINGGNTYTALDAANDNATFVCNGSAWILVQSKIA